MNTRASSFPSAIRKGEAGERERLLGAWGCTGSYLKAEFTGGKGTFTPGWRRKLLIENHMSGQSSATAFASEENFGGCSA